ncbi:hypothetical protein G6F57_019467 [Rhizopus arrhizus]|uniref:GST N-terminal domain-containing protein n=1 Tax=Rhizopus oryzae TaxID=64495 RepID=A0A9P7BJI8_RHIOR|nr:hypothetical protein G6F23_001984 [Rhizopus arrhizus]KAG0775966.1 hypothetical protein G6F21_013770 [Rhizopus arrhizus]KAG0803179.1 hypothetical protein G6F20_013753 [Rhizopus arrhizus]KAG0807776.1 hypothetical protein G6F19_013787 [Rhizopus arrhizus]KAG0808213.1 hypothetical protein G6F18_013824 [Rhizopus arrhizus]
MTENKPVLYGYFRSSATWRVRIALEVKGVDYEHRFINLLKKEQLSEEYKKVNPTQKVPSFITKEGKLLTQSQAIIEYLDEAYPNEPFLPKDPTERALQVATPKNKLSFLERWLPRDSRDSRSVLANFRVRTVSVTD